MSPEEIINRVLFRDRLAIVIDKPAGLPVHSGPGGGPNLEMFFDALSFGLPRPPALAHRLDRDTSGCLILGRQHTGLRRLGKLFQQGRIEKAYWAIVDGTPAEPEGVIDLPLAKKTPAYGWHMAVDADGQPARTEYRVLGSDGRKSWLELHPKTGRTHQIRVHCAAIGCPVVGDPVYGPDDAQSRISRLHLHSRSVRIPLYADRDSIAVEAPPPPHMVRALKACGYSG